LSRLALLLLLAGCADPQPRLEVTVRPSPSLTDGELARITRLDLRVSGGEILDTTLAPARLASREDERFIYHPLDTSVALHLEITARDAAGATVAFGAADATLSPGERASALVTLEPRRLRLEVVAGQPGPYFGDPASVVSDGNGNLYLTEELGQVIRKIVIATGEATVLAGLLDVAGAADGIGSAARFSGPQGMVYDGAGTLYVADHGGQAIRKVVIATGAVSTIVRAPMVNQPAGVALDGGDLYVSDEESHVILKVVIDTGAVSTVAGTAGMAGAMDAMGAAARFNRPGGMAGDGAGNLYIADYANQTIRKLVIATGTASTVAGYPAMTGKVDAVGTAARFFNPSGLAFDPAGDLFVGDRYNHSIRKIVLASGAVSTVAGTTTPGDADGFGDAARFNRPGGLVLDGDGSLFVADGRNQLLRKVVPSTRLATRFAGERAGSGDSTGNAARFNQPYGVVTDGDGNAYVSDSRNHTIRKIVLASGQVATLAGTAGVPGSADGTGTAATLNGPAGLVYDGAGSLYVADYLSHLVRRIALPGGEVSTIAGQAGVMGNADGTGTAAQLHGPVGVALDGAGNLYVTERDNFRIRKIALATGQVSTFAGAPGSAGTLDAPGTLARFNLPEGATSDGAGNLYVADTENHTIRKIVLATGQVSTLAGQPGASGSTDGTGAAARFSLPRGVLSDRAGSLYVADSGNHTLRKIVEATGEVTTVAGVPLVGGVKTGALPGGLHRPAAIALGPLGELVITCPAEHLVAILRSR
jgi:sugar lactone lactonase YvrE